MAKEAYKNRIKTVQKLKFNFLVKDYIKTPLKKKFEIVISSGALNSNLTDPVRYRRRAIKILWDHTKEQLAFNMAGGFPQPENKESNRVFYVNSMEILEFCLTLTSKTIFRHHYRTRDFTIIMFR